MKTFNNIVLALSGLALFYMSTMRLFDPSAVVFLQSIADPSNVLTIEMANEIRAMGAENVLAGFVAFLGIFIPRFRLTAFVVLSVIFVSATLGRSVSLVVDGVPDENIFRAWNHQAILAAMNVLCLAYILIKERKAPGKDQLQPVDAA
ncbi:DUF4345 domain-containing protein [Hoeflea sp.]|uniref:DUF4345 domain-containing protein n=1 Tax=Hoeflea sp. TaxID=1940281 RepID=UPI003B01ED77